MTTIRRHEKTRTSARRSGPRSHARLLLVARGMTMALKMATETRCVRAGRWGLASLLVCSLQSCFTVALWSGSNGFWGAEAATPDVDRAESDSAAQTTVDPSDTPEPQGAPVLARILFTPYSLALDAVLTPIGLVGIGVAYVGKTITGVDEAIGNGEW
ncbi:MAG: hypothetical protein H6838_18230 [Planctomycetes bacterium]|nr:hypothetical protein [Planctomycetota bacterium]